ncbi:MAG: hypothetical protein H0V19_03595 [Euzebyales bacterium]|nr:hypothetical protein [Euzebyales bacterium]
MYRDDTCAVCGESLPPDHFYCREHAATVDDRLHEIGALLGRLGDELTRLAELLGGVAPQTWDYLAEGERDDPEWPPVPPVALSAHAEDVDVDVDDEPGSIRVALRVPLDELLGALAAGLRGAAADRVASVCAQARNAGATH